MELLERIDRKLLAAIQDGLPFEARPYELVAAKLGIDEEEVITRLKKMRDAGIIRRFGLVLRHHELGFKANAMTVWDVPDELIDEHAELIRQHDFVTLCYARRRHLPDWPYNLYCMIHGKNRETVLSQIATLNDTAGLSGFKTKILFSSQRFKQYGARFNRHERGAA